MWGEVEGRRRGWDEVGESGRRRDMQFFSSKMGRCCNNSELSTPVSYGTAA